ncbi:MAG: hypothetical protein Kow0059_19940 [Candidatus Sumerlaeia bacterium]
MIRPSTRYVLIIVVLGITAFEFAKTTARAWNAWGIDYDKHWLAYERIARGQSPYTGEPPDNYPAFTKPLFAWLMLFDFRTGEVMWDAWNALMLVGAALLAALFYRPRPPAAPDIGEANAAGGGSGWPAARRQIRALLRDTWWAWAPFLVLTFTPATHQFAVGNIAPTVFFLLTGWGALVASGGDRPGAGVVLAMASLIKALTAFVLLAFVLARRRRAVVGAAAVGALYVLGVTLAGWWDWEKRIYLDIWPAFTWDFRGICYGLNRLLAQTLFPWAWSDADAFRRLSVAVSGVVLAASSLILWLGRGHLRTDDGFHAGLSFSLAALPLINPLLEYHHYVWLVPAWLLLWRRWAEGRIADGAFLAQLPCWALIVGAAWWGNLTGAGFWPALAGAAGLWGLNARLLLNPI